MSPDMKRLCLAAVAAHDEWFGEEGSITPAGAEEVVRSVLMALREPSQGAQQAGGDFEVWVSTGEEEYTEEVGPRTAAKVFTAMIDHILADPVKS